MRIIRNLLLAVLLLLLLIGCFGCSAKQPVSDYLYPQYKGLHGYSIYDYDGPWYLESTCDVQQEFSVYPHIKVPKEQKDYVIKLPGEYATEIEGIEYKVEFFQEYYEYNDLIQVKYTLTNHTGYTLEYSVPRALGHFDVSGGSNRSLDPLYLRRSDYVRKDTHWGVGLLENGASIQRAMEIEDVFYADPLYFAPGAGHAFVVRFCATPVATSSDEYQVFDHEFAIPVEIVLRDK